MKTNYHTHTYLCHHASGTVEDYINKAIEENYDEIGMSDHGPMFGNLFPRMTYDEFENIYLKDLERLQAKHRSKIKIYKSLEVEYLYGNDQYYKQLNQKLDYLILGQHYFTNQSTQECISTYNISSKEDLENYTQNIIDALNTKQFKILAHPDLFMISYRRFDAHTEEMANQIIDACIQNDVIMEYNANGIRKAKMYNLPIEKYDYPNLAFWKVVEKSKVNVIVNSDCHHPQELSDDSESEARSNVRQLNLNVIEKIEF